MTEEKKSYYAIIPASVRYNKNITANAKLLYGEITALCNEKGYCWASNDYFANLYGVSKASISAWINQLAREKYISIQMIYNEGTKEILNRYIRLFEYHIQENLNTPIQENLKDNITIINNTSNNTNNILSKQKPAQKTYSQDFLNFWDVYPKKESKGNAYKCFNSLLKNGVTIETIHERLKTYKARIRALNTAYGYIRNPSTFLNNIEDYADGFVPEQAKQPYSKPLLDRSNGYTLPSAAYEDLP